MVRIFISAALALILMTGVSVAAGKGKGKKGQAVHGTIKKVDAKEGTITVAVKAKKAGTANREFKLGADTKVVVVSEGNKSKLTGPEALKNEGFKEGATVTVVTDESDATKVTQVRLGGGKKKNNAQSK
ncbi:MAG TPA: hypothetical protein VKU02_16325 [Gemmataceae bacterium]|nr:hypothetical protein [Gemmataceae bacterium]